MKQSTAVVTQQKSDNKRRKQQGKDVEEEEWTREGKEGRKQKIGSNEIENNKR